MERQFAVEVRKQRAVLEDIADAAAQRHRVERAHVLAFDRDSLGISLGAFSFGYYWYVMVTWLPDYLMTQRHLPLRTAGFYAALPFLIFTISEPLGGWIADRLIRFGWNAAIARKTVITLSFLCGLLLIPAMHAQSPIRTIWLIAGSSLAGCSVANYFVFAQCCAPEDEVGVWTGVTNFAVNIAGVAGEICCRYF